MLEGIRIVSDLSEIARLISISQIKTHTAHDIPKTTSTIFINLYLHLSALLSSSSKGHQKFKIEVASRVIPSFLNSTGTEHQDHVAAARNIDDSDHHIDSYPGSGIHATLRLHVCKW